MASLNESQDLVCDGEVRHPDHDTTAATRPKKAKVRQEEEIKAVFVSTSNEVRTVYDSRTNNNNPFDICIGGPRSPGDQSLIQRTVNDFRLSPGEDPKS